MALRALPGDVRSLLSASSQINTYKRAVEELVYNSLDAESTSIAIRIHIQLHRIQVIDNGFGITKNDFDAIGKRHMTSKLTDLRSLKSKPNCYGYRGESLSNILEVSHTVKIVSRYKDEDETWAKIFCKGKKKQFNKMTTRPSKGTTVEIRGFLYNLNIQRHCIDPVNDLQNIKTFLEQLSVVHDNISLSLRDDSRNEIILKIHKKRDIYQTLSSLFSIDKDDVQELAVEKNKYKVKALIGKSNEVIGKHWIFLNGKFIHGNSKLHKIINEQLKKYIRKEDKKKSKSKNNHDEDHLFKQNIPFYFVFVSCPYYDYDVSSTVKHAIVEFKNWDQIKSLLEKLVKFYIGDVNLKLINKTEKQIISKQPCVGNETRDQVKKIINKILGSNSRKIRVSQLQNGVKGKMVKRKSKNKNKKVKNQHLNWRTDERKEKQVTNVTQNDRKINTPSIMNYSNILSKTDSLHDDCNNHNHKSTTEPNTKIPDSIIPDNIEISKLKEHQNKNKTLKKLRQGKITRRKDRIKKNIRTKLKNKNQCVNFLKLQEKIGPRETCELQESTENLNQQNKCHKFYVEKYTNMNHDDVIIKNMNYNSKDMTLKKPSLTGPYQGKMNNYILNKIQRKPFKTTYDLVQTILASQKKYKESNLSEQSVKDCRFNQKINSVSRKITFTSTKPRLPLRYRDGNPEYLESIDRQSQEYNTLSNHLISCELTCENTYHFGKYTNVKCTSTKNTIGYSMPKEATHNSLRFEDIFVKNSEIFCTKECSPFYFSNIPPNSALTYDSHNYSKNIFATEINTGINQIINNRRDRVRFITKQSRDNFTNTKDAYKKLYQTSHKKESKPNLAKYIARHQQSLGESYTIQFTETEEMNIFNSRQQNSLIENGPNLNRSDNLNDKLELDLLADDFENYEPNNGFGNTYTLSNVTISSENFKEDNQYQAALYTDIDLSLGSSNIERRNNCENNGTNMIATQNISNDIHAKSVIEPQQSHEEIDFINNIDPINVCKTVFNDNGTIEKEFAISFNRNSRLDDSLYNNYNTINVNEQHTEKYSSQIVKPQNEHENTSHHFSNILLTNNINVSDNINANVPDIAKIQRNNAMAEKSLQDNEEKNVNRNDTEFNFKNRLRFLPKGMSQIFEKCGSRYVCDYNLDGDYYDNLIYDDFENDVQKQSEIYEPVIQNVDDLSTKDINKFKNKINKDNTSLVFDEKSLKEVIVLNQVDCKFIVAIIKEKYRESKISLEYLVLFDQHAVHERIRLERNLADYYNEDRWNTVPLDNVTLKISEDEILYLHNYKEKFNQLGLQWIVLNNNEISVSSIPEAILGKNPREVDKVMKAVKNLIKEEINVIKSQRGCISLYPKSIMDLVFSEACRYAIKFGDKLSKTDCVKLIQDLSNCKTPFQCAHGRPVIAVLVDIKRELREYKIDMASVHRFVKEKKENTK